MFGLNFRVENSFRPEVIAWFRYTDLSRRLLPNAKFI